jgi:hypothetical protein
MGTEVTPTPDHVAQAQENMAPPLQGARISALVASLVRPAQELDKAALEVRDYVLDPDQAFGAGLDQIGNLAGAGRAALSDALYRIAIKVRVRVNRSTGRSKDATDIAALARPDNPCEVTTYRPRTMVTRMTDRSLADTAIPIAQALAEARPNATACYFVYQHDDPCLYFSDQTPVVDSESGLGDFYTPTLGGCLASVVDLNAL